MDVPVRLAGEGVLDLAVLRRLVRVAGLVAGDEYNARGAGRIDSRLLAYNAAAQHWPWVIVRDLDRAPCAVAFVKSLLPQPAEWMCLRVAVRSIESWVLADRDGFAEAFKVRLAEIPKTPDEVPNPKLMMLHLMSKSRNRVFKESMVRSRPGTKLEIGPQYNSRLSEFVGESWNHQCALRSSPTLARAWMRIEEFSARIGDQWKHK